MFKHLSRLKNCFKKLILGFDFGYKFNSLSTKVPIVEGASIGEQKPLGSKDNKSGSPTEGPEGVNCIPPHERLFRNTVVYLLHHNSLRETKDILQICGTHFIYILCFCLCDILLLLLLLLSHFSSVQLCATP